MKNNSIFTFSQNIWQGDSISVYFFVCKFKKKNSAAPSPPPIRCYVPGSKSNFQSKNKRRQDGKGRKHTESKDKKKLRHYTSTYPIEAKPSTVATGVRRTGQCYRCHQNVHWKNNCTEKIDQNLCKFAVACLERNQLKATHVNTCKAIVFGLEK